MQSQGLKKVQKCLAFLMLFRAGITFTYLKVGFILTYIYKTFMSSQESVRNCVSILWGKGAQNPLKVDV